VSWRNLGLNKADMVKEKALLDRMGEGLAIEICNKVVDKTNEKLPICFPELVLVIILQDKVPRVYMNKVRPQLVIIIMIAHR
jgi:hypothetical protein